MNHLTNARPRAGFEVVVPPQEWKSGVYQYVCRTKKHGLRVVNVNSHGRKLHDFRLTPGSRHSVFDLISGNYDPDSTGDEQ